MYISAAKSANKKEVIVWERTPLGREEKRFPIPYYFYVKNENGPYKDIYGNPLIKLEFSDFSSFKSASDKYKNQGHRLFESDIRAEYKILAEHYTNAPLPQTHFTLFDIEVDYDKKLGYKDVKQFTAPINAIALHHYWSGEDYVLLVPPPNRKGVTVSELNIHKEYPNVNIKIFDTEKELLREFLRLIADSDIISGWNSMFFDVPYIYERLKLLFGENIANMLCFDNAPSPKYREVIDKKNRVQMTLDLFGRESVDYLEIFKKFEVGERASFALEAVSEERFPNMKKLEYEGTLYDLYREDFEYFIRYNIRDCEILKAMEDDLGYMRLAIQFAHSSTGMLRDVTGTTKLAETFIANFCHSTLDARVPDSQYGEMGVSEKFTGALVLAPQVGLHDWVASVDVASLYPSAMRTLNISPETIVGQFFDNHKAFERVSEQSDEKLFFKYENGEMEERTAKEWRQHFKDSNYSISGYGTVFDLRKQGFIPAILTEWFKQRKHYKNLAGAAKDAMKLCAPNSAEYVKHKHDYENYHRLQYIFKIRLNSLYGALGNKYFKFYDLRLAESTTRSGQAVLMHMVRTTAENIDGEYCYPSHSIIYSDTDSCYFLTHAEDLDTAIQVGRAIEKKVNKSFPPFCKQAFLCTDEYSNLISTELDVIASKSIFIKKKYYVMQLEYAENARVDKIKLMGVQLKKTTIPKPIATTLSDFVQQLLKGKPWLEFGYAVTDYKDHLKTDAPIELIGLPKGINGLEEKEAEYNSGNKKLMLSGGAAASIFYNKCLDAYGDTESLRIVSGMKIRVYFLRKKFGRFKSIALPTDLKKTPEWFIEHFSGIVDRDHQLQVLVEKPLGTILNAIGQLVPSRQNLLYDELVSY